MENYKRYHPVNAKEYPRYSGLRTFMRLPHLTDLSHDVDIAVVGVPFDTGGTYRVGARLRPGQHHRFTGSQPRPRIYVSDRTPAKNRCQNMTNNTCNSCTSQLLLNAQTSYGLIVREQVYC